MTTTEFISRNLRYHWRGNLAVMAGIILGTAILTGALLVGDSLRGSLRELSLDQLGWVDHAMVPNRFFRQALAREIGTPATAALMLQGTASSDEKITLPKVNIFGVDDTFWTGRTDASFWQSNVGEAVLNESLATALHVKVGDSLRLGVHKVEAVPRETLLGKRKSDQVLETVRVKVREILPDRGLARFNLQPSPEIARNLFVPIRFLQDRLELSGKANGLLASSPQTPGAELNKKLTSALKLEDWGLKLRTPAERAKSAFRFLDPRNDGSPLKKVKWNGRVPDELAKSAQNNVLHEKDFVAYYEKYRNYHTLESDRMILDAEVISAAEASLRPKAQKTREVFVYLADSLRMDGVEVPYSTVAAIQEKGPNTPAKSPFDIPQGKLRLMQWPGTPFTAKAGDEVSLAYYSPDPNNHLELLSAKFQVETAESLKDEIHDPDLVPELPGVTDKLDMANWENPPFPYNPRRVKASDEDYWKRYRTTPRVYLNLAEAQRLWGSRFGNLTSYQIITDVPVEELREALRKQLDANHGGFVFRPVREQAIRAGGGSQDFGVLFLAFSWFLIVAALLLVGLLIRLNIDRRAGEIGLLLATGWSHAKVRWLILAEGCVLVFVGAALGLAGAIGYAELLLRYLAANWPGDDSLNFLRLHIESVTLGLGFSGSALICMLTLWWSTRILMRLAPRALLAGETVQTVPSTEGSRWRSSLLVVLAFCGAVGLLSAGFFIHDTMGKSLSFFGGGFFLLTALITLAWRNLTAPTHVSRPQPSLTLLGVRNAGRNAVRSVLTLGLLAAASFMIVAVQSFHKQTDDAFFHRTGGSGGFQLFAESDVPIFQDLNQPKAREDLGFPEESAKLFEGVQFLPLRVQPGDDASCLNLYQPLKPRILGVSPTFIQRQAFHFASSLATSPDESANPWTLLDSPSNDGAIPAIIDKNSSDWILKVGLGQTFEVQDDAGKNVKLRVVGLLGESMFQSEVLVSEKNLLRLFPRQEGFQFVLVDTGKQPSMQVRQALERTLSEHGWVVRSPAERLQAYLAVENTYLSTFQALGGLGLLLGAVGLAVVLIRGVLERRGELALLRALGFESGQVAWLVLAENVYLMALGLGAGTLAATLAVIPYLAETGTVVVWSKLLLMLLGVVAVGFVSGLFAVQASLRTPVITALRRE